MKTFVRFSGYTDQGGKRHLKHVLRLQTQRKELEGNRVQIIGDDPIRLLEEGFGPLRTGKAGRPVTKPLKEWVVSGVSVEQAERVKEYLEERFDRKVYGVLHDDETVEHAHFLMTGLEEGKSKAIRLGKGDLEQVYRDISKLLDQELTPYGQGRKRVPFKVFMADPEYARQKIEDEMEQNQIILSQAKQIIDLYGYVDIYALSPQGRFRVIDYVDNVDEVPLKRLKGLNVRGEGICFCPSQDQDITTVFIDDISKEKGLALLDEYQGILTETSTGKYQVHLKLDEPLDDKNVTLVQRALTAKLDGDRASTDSFHLRRFPGFANTKHADKPWVKIVKYNLSEYSKCIRGKELVEEYHKSMENRLERLHAVEVTVSKQTGKGGKMKGVERLNVIDTYRKFCEGWDVDLSVADFRFTMYLISKGFSDNEVKEALKIASPDIEIRKKGHLDDYIDRTLSNAKERLGLQKGVER